MATNSVLVTDAAAVMRATGLVRSFIARDGHHVNAIMEATLEDTEHDALIKTFTALVGMATLMAIALDNTDAFSDTDQAIDTIQRWLLRDVMPQEATP